MAQAILKDGNTRLRRTIAIQRIAHEAFEQLKVLDNPDAAVIDAVRIMMLDLTRSLKAS